MSFEESGAATSSVATEFVEQREPENTDEELAEKAKAGCAGSLNSLLTMYRPWIYWFVRRLGVSGHHDIEELTQETLIQIQRSIWRFEGRSKISSWIASTEMNFRTPQSCSCRAFCGTNVPLPMVTRWPPV